MSLSDSLGENIRSRRFSNILALLQTEASTRKRRPPGAEPVAGNFRTYAVSNCEKVG